MSVIGLISNFGETVVLNRYAVSSLVNGKWVAGLITLSNITMSVQPLNGDEIEELSAGQRTRNVMKGYTATFLHTADEPNGLKADFITHDAKNYEVQTVEPWKGDLTHWKIIMTELLR